MAGGGWERRGATSGRSRSGGRGVQGGWQGRGGVGRDTSSGCLTCRVGLSPKGKGMLSEPGELAGGWE
eukprot:821181-Rhodomonas_salina.2